MVDPNLEVERVVEGLVTPSTMAFLDTNEFFILEKNTGQVKQVVDGSVEAVVLDLDVTAGLTAVSPDWGLTGGVSVRF